jgi:solute carrier family 7 (L-type amino acid transporter), member 5
MGLLITAAGVPFYYLGVVWKDKPEWFQRLINNMTCLCQKIFLSAKEEVEDE